MASPADESTNRTVEIKSSDRNIMWKVHLGMVLVELAYAGSYVLNKIALTNGVNPIVFAVYRDITCLALLFPLGFFMERSKRRPLTFEVFALLVVNGFFGPFITQMLLLYGVLFTSAGYASTISVLTPLFTFIISAVFRFEEIRWNRPDGKAKFGGLISALCGSLILAIYLGPVVLGHADTLADTIPMSELEPCGSLAFLSAYLKMGRWHLGVFFLFLGGVTLSISICIQVPLAARYPAPISVAAGSFFFGALMLLITAVLTIQHWSDLVVNEKAAVISYIYSGVAPAAFSYTVLVWGVQKAGPVLVATYTPLQLFSAVALAYVFLGESVHLGSFLGAVLIVVGLGFITWGQVKSRAEGALLVKAVAPLEGVGATTAAAAGLEEPLLG